jgi:hypothetical protein
MMSRSIARCKVNGKCLNSFLYLQTLEKMIQVAVQRGHQFSNTNKHTFMLVCNNLYFVRLHIKTN